MSLTRNPVYTGGAAIKLLVSPAFDPASALALSFFIRIVHSFVIVSWYLDTSARFLSKGFDKIWTA